MEQTAGIHISLLEEREKQLAASTTEQELKNSESFLSRYMDISALDDGLMREMIRKIVVFPNNAIQIVWNFSDIPAEFRRDDAALPTEVDVLDIDS